MTLRLQEVLEAAGISREEMRAVVRRRQEEVIAEEQQLLDADLLRLGREFRREAEGRRVPGPPPPKVRRRPLPPPLIETEGCAAYRCTNAAHLTVTDEFNGRTLRVRYCTTHGEERRAELAGAVS